MPVYTLDFENLAAGDIVNNQYEGQGVTISSAANNPAMVFDTDNPTGGDGDLATNNLGNVLIVSEDGDSSDPDDNAGGGSICFTFDEPTDVKNLTVLDNEEGGYVKFWDVDGNYLGKCYLPKTADNGQALAELNMDDVGFMQVTLCGSGAIDNITYDSPIFTDPEGDGYVEGTAGNDVIDATYTGDPDGDMIDAGDAILPGEGPQDDIVLAGSGHDTVLAGEGDDDVYAGTGDDYVEGGDGNDLLLGDADLPGGAGQETLRESFNWDELSEGEIDSSAAQDTGNVTVTYVRTMDTGSHDSNQGTATLNVDGIDTGGEAIDTDSSLQSITHGEGNTGQFEWNFSEEVENVEFNINDIDGDGVVTVQAFDADGNPIEVQLDGGNKLTLLDNDGVAGADTADSEGGYDDTDSDDYNLQVTIPGPVAKIVVTHTQDGDNNSGVNVTDIYFDVTTGDIYAPGEEGNDTLDGGAGDDVIHGHGGDDVLIGGSGTNYLSGGTGDDTFIGGDGADTFQGNAGQDNIDYSGSDAAVNVDLSTGTLSGGDADNDTIEGGIDGIIGSEFDDVLTGFDHQGTNPADTFTNEFFGNGGDDIISGKDGDDYIDGGADDDIITGGGGADILKGGDDRDTFIGATDGDEVDGGEGGDDWDILDLSGEGPLSVAYDPSNPENGTVTFYDGAGNVTGTMEFENIEQVILPPEAPDAQDDTAETDEDTSVVIDVLANDSDPNGDPLEVTSATADNGTVTINPDGTITYEPDENFNGTDTITYTIDDGNGGTDTATVTVTVNPVNDDPEAADDTAETDEDTPVVIDVLDNDSDVDGDPLEVTSATADNGTVTINPDGTVTYEPDENFNGTDTITYEVSDGNGGTDTATVTVTVNPVNDDPEANDDTATVEEDGSTVIPVLDNDTDVDGDPLTVTDADAPNGTVTINPDGTLTYEPDPDFTGEDTITYTVDDGNGGTDTATVTVTVTPVNDAPEAADDTAETDEDTPVVIDVLDNDSDPDGDPLDVTGGTADNGTVTVNPDGTITYTPDENFNGTDTITYEVSDGNGGTDTATVTVTVNPVNDDPEANDDTATTPFNTAVIIPVLDNDTDVDGDSLTVTDATSPDGDVTINPDGTLTFEPTPGFEGTATITYEVSDGNGGTDTAEVTVTVEEQPLDGIVQGTAGDDLIDYDYTGDPHGDMVDHLDEILPGEGPNDDIIEAYEGNDTILSGLGDDDIYAGEGDDYVDAGDGDDIVRGGDGSDTVLGGEGDDYIDTSGTDPASDYGFPPLVPEDADKTNDLDTVDGGAGNDTIITGDDRDTITGGTGDDTIDGGLDDDTIDGGEDNDFIIGGHGSDIIDGGTGDDVIFGGLGVGTDDLNIVDALDPRPDNGIDVIHGGEGNDIIYGQDDDDELYGDEGDDYIDGGIDEDTIHGGSGADTLLGGQGDDVIDGGIGADVIDGGDDNDTIDGGQGSDTILGGAGDDVLDGGTGGDYIDGGDGDDTVIGTTGRDELLGGADDDTITGGLGEDEIDGGTGDDVIDAGGDDDVVDGGAGNDAITGGKGNDTLSGGDDRDTFTGLNAGDTVDGGAGGDDWDVLDLTGSAPSGGSLQVTITGPDSNGNGSDGFVTYYDAAGNVTGTLQFEEIEEIVPCFTPGTMIATPKGERRVEDLQEGDRVITRDNGIQQIRWVGHKPLTWQQMEAAKHLKPVLIQAGSLGNGLPERDMLVSPNHRVLVANDRTALYFEEREVLVSAKHLVDNKGVHRVDTMGTTYIHFMFDHHEVVLSDGAWTESFQPGDYSLKGIGNAQRTEIFELFPELETAEGIEDYTAARRTLKAHEAKMLLK